MYSVVHLLRVTEIHLGELWHCETHQHRHLPTAGAFHFPPLILFYNMNQSLCSHCIIIARQTLLEMGSWEKDVGDGLNHATRMHGDRCLDVHLPGTER